MTFVDTSVFMYAVGGEHPHRAEAREFFRRSIRDEIPLVTSAKVLQELVDAYLATSRPDTLDAAFRLAEGRIASVWPVEEDDVRLAMMLSERLPGLDARGLLHLASCRRRDVGRLKSFDRALESAFD